MGSVTSFQAHLIPSSTPWQLFLPQHPADMNRRYFLIANNASYNGFDRRLMADAVLMDASVGPPYGAEMPEQLVPPASVAASATFSLLVSEGYSNLRGVMHGGAAGVIFDMLTTVALAPISRPGHWE